MRRAITTLVLAAAVVVYAAPARAEGFFVPWGGVNFGTELANGRKAFGVSGGRTGGGVIGYEFDFGYSPSFFGTDNDFGANTVITATGNIIIGIPIGGTRGPGIRPYVVGGVGLIRTQIDGGSFVNISESNNEFGYDLGGGLSGFFSDHVGLRGDLRYFRWLHEDEARPGVNFNLGTFNFWRASIGLVIR